LIDRRLQRPLLLGLLLFRGGAAVAQAPSAEEARRAPLAGLTGVRVVVEAPNAEAQSAGLGVEALRTVVEGRLRRAGILVVDDPQGRLSPPGFPTLHAGVRVEPLRGHGHLYGINLNLRQAASLVRKPALIVNASTWHAGGLGRGAPDQVLEALGRYCDQFVSDYQAANPGAAKP
jgi:hypothetical protein